MNDQEKDRLIVEALGECWHDWKEDTLHDLDALKGR